MKWNKGLRKMKERRAREKESTQTSEGKKAKRKVRAGGKEPTTGLRVM